jgi:uncharacterized protein
VGGSRPELQGQIPDWKFELSGGNSYFHFMADKKAFSEAIHSAYDFKGEKILVGVGELDKEVVEGAQVWLPLRTMNRHGLIAGATGTGKTKTLQMICEGLSDASVPVLILDIKGDLSGIAMPGEVNDKVIDRAKKLGVEFKPAAFPVELLNLGKQEGLRLRATVSEFGPVLLSRILGLNDTQGGLVAMIFKYCDDVKLPLLDLKDFIRVLQFVTNEGKADMEKSYGKISASSTGTILRKVIELQQQGGDDFFGEKSFEVDDLMRIDNEGRGIISVLRVSELQDRPKLFSTFLLQLLAELYATSPEEGDMEKPKLVVFIDEAHLVFNESSKTLLEQIETVVKLIRSKGIGIFFCTQNPMDIPASVLSQLGLKIQHALRAFTAADRKVIKQTAENYPETKFYKTEDLITELGIGEALVTMLNEKGIPTPLVHTLMVPPRSRMDVLTKDEVLAIAGKSSLVKKYNEDVDSESAYEILNAKLKAAAEANETKSAEGSKPGRPKKEESWIDNPMVRSAGRTAATILTRSLLGVLGIGSRRRR